MNPRATQALVALLTVCLPSFQVARAAPDPAHDTLAVRAFVNDACIIADEPYFVPAAASAGGDQAKFLPLIGLVVGKLAELFINHEIQASAARMKAGAARRDTHYAVSRHMYLYRADFQPAPALAINAKLGCMTIVAATFQPDPIDCTADYVPKTLAPQSATLPESDWTTTRTDTAIENQLRRANICVQGKVHAVYEARFEFSKDGTAYRLKDAGFHVAALLTTTDKGASRNTIYTLKISDPAATDQQEVLSSAWVDIGPVRAGAESRGVKPDAAPWLRVPPLSVEGRRSFDDQTRVHQEDIGEIDALQRALVRNQRMLAGLDQRIAGLPGADLLEGLKQERNRIAVRSQSQSAELDARKAEYAELPRTPLEFMPVTIEVAVTETESEKKSRLALAEIIGKNSAAVASAVGGAASGLLSKTVDTNDIELEPGQETMARRLDQLKARYFDALIEARAPGSDSGDPASRQTLVDARDRYNEARRSYGLEKIN